MRVKNIHFNQVIELDFGNEFSKRIEPLQTVTIPDKYKNSPVLDKHKDSISILEQKEVIKETVKDKKIK